MEKRVAFIIPGYNEPTNLFRYRKIAKFFKSKGIKVIQVNLNWKYKVMSDYINEFRDVFKENKGRENIFFGFSFGAFVSFASAIELKPKIIVLCSISPYFVEDLKIFPKSWKKREKRRLLDMKIFEFNKMVKKIKCKTYLFVGEKEHKILINRSKNAKKKLRIVKSKLLKILSISSQKNIWKKLEK